MNKEVKGQGVVSGILLRRVLIQLLKHMAIHQTFCQPLCAVLVQLGFWLWMPGGGLVAGLRGLLAMGVLLSWGAGCLASSGSPWTYPRHPTSI